LTDTDNFKKVLEWCLRNEVNKQNFILAIRVFRTFEIVLNIAR